MGTKTTIAGIAVVGGSLHDQPNNVLVDERTAPFARGRSRGSLYLLVELSGAGTEHDAIARQMLQVMRQTYYSQKGSVTAGLRQAVYQANEMLLEENHNSLPGEQRSAGVSCAVLRGDDLFIAQAGPALIYLLHQGQESRYPDRSPWLDGFPPEEVDAVPLGARHELNVDLYHSQIGPGDTLLLGSSGLARDIAPAAWPRILSETMVSALLEGLRRQGGGFDLSALVVRLADAAVDGGGAQPVAPETTTAPREVAASPPARTPIQPERRLAASDRAPVQAKVVPPPPPEPSQEFVDPDEEGELEETGSIGAQIAEAVAQIRLTRRLKEVLAAGAAALAGLWYGLLSLLRRMMPGRLAAPQIPVKPSSTTTKAPARRKAKTQPRTRSESVQKLLIGVAIAIPIIVAVVVLVAWVQRGEARRAEQEALWQQANAFWEQAQVDTDVTLARTRLENAQQFVDEFLTHQPEHAEALDLQKKIQDHLDLVNQVRRIDQIERLNSYPSDAKLTRVVVQGAHIFVMDRHNGQVYHHSMADQQQNALDPASTTVLVSSGDQVANVMVGDLVDMVWMPTGPSRQKASLVILESGGSLLDYDPATKQLVPLKVAAFEAWKYPKLVGSHSGRFYLLDSTGSKIWRYDPTPDGYSSLPHGWLQIEVDLAGVVDMAIGDSIYLLFADGAIRKFSQGAADTFDISDWDTPPRNPASIFTRTPAETRWIYVADRGNKRIVQSSKEGQFKQQFRLADDIVPESGDALAGATDLFVDEITGHAYLLSGRDLYLLMLPLSE